MNRLQSFFILVLLLFLSYPAFSEEQTIYEGPLVLSGNNYATISAENLSELEVGDVVKVYVSNITSTTKSATACFNTGTGVALFADESSFKIYGTYSLIVSNACLSAMKNYGLGVGGSGYTIEEVTLEHDPSTKVLFEGSLQIGNYSPTLSIPKFQFNNLKVGDEIRVKVSGLSDSSRGCLQQYDWGELKIGYSGFELTGDYSMVVDEDVLQWLHEGVLRVRGAYHIVNKVELYCPGSGYASNFVKRDAPMYFGLNESGGEFAGVYPGIDQTHYGYPDRNDIRYAAKKGFRIIRLPFRWERIERPVGSGKLIDTEIKKIKQVLSYAEEYNLRVVFDMHNFGRYCTYCNGSTSADNVYKVIGEGDVTVDAFAQVWRLLAEQFKDYEQIWAYEIMNEPYSMLSSTPWLSIAQAAIYSIREVDMSTPILIDGDSFASASRWVSVSDNLRTLNDPADNLIFSAHSYFDKDSSGNYSESYDSSGANSQTGVTRMKPFVDWCQKYGLRGFVGEYGIPDNDSRWLTVLENALKYLQENNIGGTYWSAGHRWGNYALAVHPTNNYTTDRPQMAVLEKYIYSKDILADMGRQVQSSVQNTDNLIYNLSGQKIRKPYKGIVISNGHKYLMH